MIIEVKGVQGNPIRVVLEKIEDKYMVKFFDARHKHTPDGQFISDYYLDTILDGLNGLDLYTSEPSWKIDARWMSIIRDWASYHIYHWEG
jgi:hypothetical protein